MSVKIQIKTPADGLTFVQALEKCWGIKINKIHMETNGKSTDLDFTPPPLPRIEDQLYPGGKP